ncbi:hypothetical protein [Streptomyces sp. NPDC093094]|uniref:hypothetical protein n=1 Tax=Streptomyces sp. NPDC093094 TaxID=3366026 RepID=UPI0038137277
MTSLTSRTCLTACAVTASALLLASCTSGGKDTAGTAPSPAPSASAAFTASGASEEKLTQQLGAALDGFRTGTVIESGAERIQEGIHTEPLLTEGAVYRLNLVCVGKGSAQALFTPEGAGDKTAVPCDGSVVQQRITADGPLRIDVDGRAGATGMVAWEIDEI